MRPSGKFVVRLPPELHASLQRDARARAMSLNDLCRQRLGQDSGFFSSDLLAAVQGLPVPLVGVILFGSRAKGEATESSDTDLLLVLEKGTVLSRDLYTAWDDHLRARPGVADSMKLTPHFAVLADEAEACGSLWLEVSLSGIPIWEKYPGKIEKTLFHIREAIAEGRFSRRMSHGHPYWVRRDPSEK